MNHTRPDSDLRHIPTKMKTRIHSLFILAALILATACGGGAATEVEGQGGHSEETGGHEEGGSTVTVTPQQFAAIDGKLGMVEQKELTATLKATGFLKVPPQNMADISASMGGIVREVLVQEGDHVRKGQSLATISDQAIVQLQRDYLDAKARLTYAKTDLERQTELAGANVSAQKTLQKATADHASLQASVNGSAELLRLINIDPEKLNADNVRGTASITSPIDGTVAHIAVNVGSKVSGDTPLMRVVNNSKLHVDVFIYEQDIAKVKDGQKVDLSLTNLPGKTYTAVIFAIGSAFEDETKTIPVHAEITGDKDGLIDGMSVTARIDVGQAKVSAVLSAAIVSNEGNDYIFIRTVAEKEHGHDPGAEPAHKEEAEHAHAEGEEHDHAKENAAAHAKGEEHEHDHAGVKENGHGKEHAMEGNMSFKRIQVKRGTTDGAYTGVAFMEAVPDGAEVAVGGAYYLLAMMNTSAGHEH